MSKEQHIKQLEQEIEQFDYQRLKFQEQIQQVQTELQQSLASVNQSILIRRGEIVGLQRLIAEEKEEENGNKPS